MNPIYPNPDALDDLYKALKKLYDAFDSCVELTPEVLLYAQAAIRKAETPTRREG